MCGTFVFHLTLALVENNIVQELSTYFRFAYAAIDRFVNISYV